MMSIQWKDACPGDLKRLQIITKLFEGCPKLLGYLFHPSKPQLSAPTEELLHNPYSSGEKVLLQVAIDVWNGDGKTLLMDLNRLDSENLMRAIEAFAAARRL